MIYHILDRQFLEELANFLLLWCRFKVRLLVIFLLLKSLALLFCLASFFGAANVVCCHWDCPAVRLARALLAVYGGCT